MAQVGSCCCCVCAQLSLPALHPHPHHHPPSLTPWHHSWGLFVMLKGKLGHMRNRREEKLTFPLCCAFCLPSSVFLRLTQSSDKQFNSARTRSHTEIWTLLLWFNICYWEGLRSFYHVKNTKKNIWKISLQMGSSMHRLLCSSFRTGLVSLLGLIFLSDHRLLVPHLEFHLHNAATVDFSGAWF